MKKLGPAFNFELGPVLTPLTVERDAPSLPPLTVERCSVPPPSPRSGAPLTVERCSVPPPSPRSGAPLTVERYSVPPPSPRSGAPLTVERCSVPPPFPRSGAPLTVERCSVPPPSPRSGAPLTVERCPVPPPSPRSGAPLTVERCPVPPPPSPRSGAPLTVESRQKSIFESPGSDCGEGGGNLPLALRGQGRPWLWRGGGHERSKWTKRLFLLIWQPRAPPLSTVRGAPDCGEAGADYPPPFHGQSLDFQILIFQLSVSRLHRGLSLMSGRILGVFDLDLISRYENPQKTFKTNTKTTILRLFLYFWVIF